MDGDDISRTLSMPTTSAPIPGGPDRASGAGFSKRPAPPTVVAGAIVRMPQVASRGSVMRMASGCTSGSSSMAGSLTSCRRRGSTGTGQPEAGVAVEPNLGFGSDRPRQQGPWMALLP